MARPDVSARAAELRAARVAFVHARVVLAERPTSATPGDEAIVLGDGTIEGFVGGTCAEGSVREAAVGLLASGHSTLLLRITPAEEPAQPGKRVVHNPCLSGGTLEVFLEPSVPPPLVVVAGNAPIARAVLAVAAAAGYGAGPWSGELPPDAAAVVVASHGRGEEPALAAAVDAGVGYVGLVASARRGVAVLDGLGLSAEQRARVRTPAGLDLGARTPGEVAVSILAEIVASRPAAAHLAAAGADAALAGAVVDPVCGMKVLPDAGGVHAEHAGATVWFCGRGCRDAWVADPAAYGA